eukprot:UN03049
MQTYFTVWRLSLHVFAYHTAIPDIGARGFFRPVALCYISPTPGKIKREFSSLKNSFANLAILLKRGGQKMFMSDINKILNNVEK